MKTGFHKRSPQSDRRWIVPGRSPRTALALVLVAACDLQAQVLDDVVVKGRRLQVPASVAGPLNESAEDAPAQVGVIPREQLREPGTHRPADALSRDASVGENYAAIGYAENFMVRGFTLDPGSAYRINGFVVPGELLTGLDNRERIEILKGVGLSASGASSPGGVINFVSRRGAQPASARFELTPRGGKYAGAEIGNSLLRATVATEHLHPYAQRASGNREFASLAFDSLVSPALRVSADLELNRRSQFGVPGFQLLGGTVLPTVAPETSTNQQAWIRPVENRSSFAAARADLALGADWTLRAGASSARARIEDNLAFPYGCNDPPFHYFCADGSYVFYDYHASEVRAGTHAELAFSGTFATGPLQHKFAAGVERISRVVRMRDFHSTTLFDAAGRGLTGNLSDPSVLLPAPLGMPIDRPDQRAAQSGAYIADEAAWERWRLQAALRFVRIAQTGMAAPAGYTLPQLALIYVPGPRTRFYASRIRGVEFGSEAPLVAENAGQLLAPRQTQQVEVGLKHALRDGLAVSAALFRMQRPYDFTASSGASFAGLGEFRRAGLQVHQGMEITARGQLAPRLRLSASVALIEARAHGTGDPAYDGVQIQGVPRARSSIYASYAFAGLPGLEASGGWIHTGSRNARRDGLASVPGYDRFDAGLAWTSAAGVPRSKLMLNVRNIMNRRYWRDSSEAYSADLLFPGAPREVFLGWQLEAP
jgi:iron complex outermembrane receptor protein